MHIDILASKTSLHADHRRAYPVLTNATGHDNASSQHVIYAQAGAVRTYVCTTYSLRIYTLYCINARDARACMHSCDLPAAAGTLCRAHMHPCHFVLLPDVAIAAPFEAEHSFYSRLSSLMSRPFLSSRTCLDTTGHFRAASDRRSPAAQHAA